MINIGNINRLKIVKQQGPHFYLSNGKSANVLFAERKLPENCNVGDSLDVFVYVDADGHLAATTKIPAAQVGDIAWLKVVSVNYYGAFLDWGLSKDLLVPFSEQYSEMKVGQSYLVKVFLDAKNRIVASTKIEGSLSEESVDFKIGQKVSLLIADKTDLGFKAIINNSYWGVLYQNELFRSVSIGQRMDGYIKYIREDKKIDLTLHEPGYSKIGPLAKRIMEKLYENDGILLLSDKSPPEAIYATFGVSKKVFKQAIGALYKDKLILIDDSVIKRV